MIRIRISIRLDALKSGTNFVTITLGIWLVYDRKNSSDPPGYHHDFHRIRNSFVVMSLYKIMF
jgi:hypothetical protein